LGRHCLSRRYLDLRHHDERHDSTTAVTANWRAALRSQ
jgi:hypothetical protein